MTFITNIGHLLSQPILNADTYKATHWTFEHPEFTNEYSYIEARKGGEFKEVQFFGPQYAVIYYLMQRVTEQMIDEAEDELTPHGVPFNRPFWKRIVDVHGGRLPVRIKALPEGIIAPQGCVLLTIESTDPELPGITAYVETLLLRAVWFPTTIATRSMRWWRMVNRYLELTGTPEASEFKIVDFGARGVSSTETAGIAGMAHLVNHQVTDNLMGVRFAKHAYRTHAMPGFSIPASEHAVTTSWGKRWTSAPERDGEFEFFENALEVHGNKVNPLGGRYPVSIVIDTYDQDEAIRMWLDLSREHNLRVRLEASNMQVVLRPDSGDPIINVVHVLDLAGSLVGWTLNDKGYRVLPDFVRVIQGDGIHEESLLRILQRVTYHGWSIDNLVFGSGGGLLVHNVERDTHRFAMKASEVIVSGETRAIRKEVKTDPSKASKAGRFGVVEKYFVDGGGTVRSRLETVTEEEAGLDDMLTLIYENGEAKNLLTFEDVRILAREYRALPSPEEIHFEVAHKLLD